VVRASAQIKQQMPSTHQMASSDDPAGVKPVEYDDTNVLKYNIHNLI
jgi:hypothetical protein